MSASTPRYIQLVPASAEGLRAPEDLPVPLPYGLEPRDILRAVEDVHGLIHRLNTVLHSVEYPPLESLLDPAGFSGLISRTVAARVAAASRRLVVNGYHNGYPDLIRGGQYPHDRVQHGEGLEVKASRSESSWQSHGPRSGWFLWLQFALDDREDVAVFDREPTQVQAVMIAELSAEDWSWAPAGEDKIRSGTASVMASGRRKLRAGAVWVAPSYAVRHEVLVTRSRLDAFDANATDAAVLAVLAASPEPLNEAQVVALLAPTLGLEPSAIRGRVRSAYARLRKSGDIVAAKRGVYRLASPS